MNEPEFLALARDRYDFAVKSDQVDRAEAIDDARMVAGDQWSAEAARARKAAMRPCLTMNRLGVFTQQIINESRDLKPALKITSLDAPDDEQQKIYDDTAEALQMGIRQIEYESNADQAYDTSGEQQVICGRGFYRVVTEYEPGTLQQRLCIKRIINQFSVYFDPAAVEYDRCDASYAFIVDSISKAEYKRRYPKQYDEMRDWNGDLQTQVRDWIGNGDQGMVRIAEYWVVERSKRTIYELPDGSVTDDKEAANAAGVLDSRVEEVPQVTQYIIDGVNILERTPWLGSRIPIIPVWGKEMVIDGVRRTYSLVRPAKDAQRLVNLYVSNIAEQIALVPKSPFLVAEGQLAGREQEWQQANSRPKAYLQYKRFVDGIDMGVPFREQSEPPIQALSIGLGQAIDAMKASMGIFDASLGNTSNEKSGIAIRERKAQTNIANFHFQDNQARSRKALGDILIELYPIVYGRRSMVTGRSEDGKSFPIRLDGPYDDPRTGEKRIIDLQSPKFQVAVSTGPSYTSQKQEAIGVYLEVMKADPEFFSYGRDKFWRNIEAPGASDIADRAEKLLPPALQKQGQQQMPPEAQQMLAQLEQQNQALMSTVEGLTAEADAKAQEIASRERIEAEKLAFQREELQARMALEYAKIAAKEDETELKTQVERISREEDREERLTMAEREAQREAEEKAVGE
jgi:hypothetical protein